MSETSKNKSKALHENLEFFADSDIGSKRSENQDRFGNVFKEDFKIFIVADGMGGAKGGAKAAQLAVSTVTEYFEKVEEVTPEEIYEAVVQANDVIFKNSLASAEYSGHGYNYCHAYFYYR